MKVLVVGSGGREHALVWKISQSTIATKVFCAPGNPGIAQLADCPAISASDIPGLLRFAKDRHIDLTVVGPEQPLADGIVDLFREAGLTIFGPTKRAAELEWSKIFAKEFMRRHSVPTAAFRVFAADDRQRAHSFISSAALPIVIKADGLAAGKGVTVCYSRREASELIEDVLSRGVYGRAGDHVVIEEFLEGEEASVFAICDGEHSFTLAPAQDYKRVFDNDQGRNTGGMGAYAPAPIVTPRVHREIEEQIIGPTLRGMMKEGRPYSGCLYVGLMITRTGPKVVEFNARFGDPETQVVLPLFDGDLLKFLLGASEGTLETVSSPIRPSGAAVCVVLASEGYPDRYPTGVPIDGLDEANTRQGIVVFHAGTEVQHGIPVTAGGRVLGVTAVCREGSLRDAIDAAYAAVGRISFGGMHYRKDIGRRGLDR